MYIFVYIHVYDIYYILMWFVRIHDHFLEIYERVRTDEYSYDIYYILMWFVRIHDNFWKVHERVRMDEYVYDIYVTF